MIQPLTITWQLVRAVGFSSRLIGWFGAGFYSHIDTVTPRGLLRGARSDRIGGMAAGVYDRPQYYDSWSAVTRFTLTVSPAQFNAYWAFSDGQLGKPYDSRGLIDTFVVGRRWRDPDAWWCSELVAANGEAADLWTVAPEVSGVEPGGCVLLFSGARAVRTELAPMASEL